jgi:hypothetical protein
MPDPKIALPTSSDAQSSRADTLERVIGSAPAPLLPGEAEADYTDVAARIVAVAQPRDAIEEFLTRDAVDLTWDILRLRRMKAGLLRAAAGKGVRGILATIADIDTHDLARKADHFAKEWASGTASVRQEFAEKLQRAGLTMDDVMAETLAKEIESFERFDRMLASAEARRNNALREIDRHRSALGAVVRQMVDEVEDAEFRDVETGEVSGGSPP